MTERADESGSGPDDGRTAPDDERRAESDGVVATYVETEAERILRFEAGSAPRTGAASDSASNGRSTAAIAQNLDGYAMLAVRHSPEGEELERYYGFEMALDHVAELLGVSPDRLPVPEAAVDMGM